MSSCRRFPFRLAGLHMRRGRLVVCGAGRHFRSAISVRLAYELPKCSKCREGIWPVALEEPTFVRPRHPEL
eukprot:14901447-Heterocapsa_arctica.AAC.1